ncbi:MAG: phosphoribosylamine--glycine ligase [Thermoplasmata archaeon]|nr:phosphoribosylamine--glycine ligase [Thermoplasmata archaeon]
MRVLVVGGGAREHALTLALHRADAEVIVAAPHLSPGMMGLAHATARVEVTDSAAIVSFAKQQGVTYAVIGPEAPLEAGVGDALRAAEIPVVGPSKAGARIEWSKRYCRDLMAKYHVEGSPKYAAVTTPEEVDASLAEFETPFVVKPVGLTAGKGVWVQGADFATPTEGAAYAKTLLMPGRAGALLEEKVEGEEFSLMAFVTDSGVYPMPAVQDFKRALEGDHGPNTGGMGSYSQRDHLLPFLSESNRDRALAIIRGAAEALRQEGIQYRGVLYGGFMLTPRGPVLMEFNARFGDPEALNVCTLYEPGDFAELLHGVSVGRVDPTLMTFRLRASVVKYIVPPGYPSPPSSPGTLDLDLRGIEELGVHLYYGSVEPAGAARVQMGSSRALALVGEASAIHEASTRVDAALPLVRGSYYVRRDIGTKADLATRTEHMRRLFSPNAKPSPLPLSVAPPDAPPSSSAPASMLT